jgi:inner membrane protein
MCLGTTWAYLLGDLVGARGPDGDQWPIPFLFPFFHQPRLTWSGQWALNAWPNVLITAGLIGVVAVLALKRGYSPLEMFSRKADGAFVAALHCRFSVPRK